MKLIIDIPDLLYYHEIEQASHNNSTPIEKAIAQGIPYEERPQGEWIDYDNTFYKCPDCGYLLEKCCPQCQNKVILPKGGVE